jgi:hypothetical protein
MSVDLHNFTDSQAEYAAAQLEKLWRERRFFLHADYTRNSKVFGRLDLLDEEHRQAYKMARDVAAGFLINAERDLGVTEPDLNGRNLVQCNRYGGGLATCTAWPLAWFAKYVPRNQNALYTEVAQVFDTDTPSLTRFGSLVEVIWKEFQRLNVRDTDIRVIVILKTQFVPDCEVTAGDLLGKPVSDLQQYPHALGYLLYRASFEQRLLPEAVDPRILTSTAVSSHVSFCYPSLYSEPQVINFHASHTYVKKVHFATVL